MFTLFGIILEIFLYVIFFFLKLIIGLMFLPFQILLGGSSKRGNSYKDGLEDGIGIGYFMSDDY